MQLEDLIVGTGCIPRSGKTTSVRITDVVEDSRTAVPGCLFIAKRGTSLDGSRFIDDALDRGAEALLIEQGAEIPVIPPHIPVLESDRIATDGALVAERFFGSPSHHLFVAGVTGTNGKTTVTALAQSMLNHANVRSGLIGTVCIDDGQEVGAASLTTPPATELSRTLGAMREHDCKAAMLECSSHALDQGRCDGLRFRAAAFTNLSGDHLDYHTDMDAYARSKAHLFEMLDDGPAIVSAADPYTPVMLERSNGVSIIRCAPADTSCEADAHVQIVGHDLDTQRLRCTGPWGTCWGVLHAPGAHNATNALFALCIAHACGLDADALSEALEHARMPPGRLQRISTGHPDEPVVYIDYAHTDDALSTTLRAIRKAMQHDQFLCAVFGCGGDRDRTKRPRMGKAASQNADRVVLTSDNPRTESPHAIIDDVLAGLSEEERNRVEVHADRAHAIRIAIDGAEPKDVIVIAGKGHEREQLILAPTGGIVRNPFDDAEVARQALIERAERIGAA